MYSKYVLLAAKYLNRTSFPKDTKHMYIFLKKYNSGTKEKNRYLLEENTKANMDSKMFSNFIKTFKKNHFKKRFLLFLTFSIVAVYIDIHCVSCEKTNKWDRIEHCKHINSELYNKEFVELDLNLQNIDEQNLLYIIKNNNKLHMTQYAANSPLEDRCYVYDLKIDSDFDPGTDSNSNSNSHDSTFIDSDSRGSFLNTKDLLSENERKKKEVYIGSEEENSFVNDFKNIANRRKTRSIHKDTENNWQTDNEKNSKNGNSCNIYEKQTSSILSDVFNTKPKCLENTNLKKKFVLLGVVDGHGGWIVAEIVKRFLKDYIKNELSKNLKQEETKIEDVIVKSLENAHLNLDNDIKENADRFYANGNTKFSRVGACSLSVLIDEDNYYVSNLGDAKGLLQRKDGFIKINDIHNASNVHERRKLIKNHPNEDDIVICKSLKNDSRMYSPDTNGNVNKLLLDAYENCYVKGRLQPTRVFGDFYLKHKKYAFDHARSKYIVHKPHSFPYISSLPEVRKIKRRKDDEFMILMSDGVTDFLKDEEIIKIVQNHIDDSVEQASKAVVYFVLKKAAIEAGLPFNKLLKVSPQYKRQLHDDTTVLIINLKDK